MAYPEAEGIDDVEAWEEEELREGLWRMGRWLRAPRSVKAALAGELRKVRRERAHRSFPHRDDATICAEALAQRGRETALGQGGKKTGGKVGAVMAMTTMPAPSVPLDPWSQCLPGETYDPDSGMYMGGGWV